MKISRCIRGARFQSGKYGFLLFLRRNFSICCRIKFSFVKCFSICVYLNSVFSLVKICFSSRVNRKVMTEFDLYLEFNKSRQHKPFPMSYGRITIKIMFLGFILHWKLRTIQLTTQSLSFIGSEQLW